MVTALAQVGGFGENLPFGVQGRAVGADGVDSGGNFRAWHERIGGDAYAARSAAEALLGPRPGATGDAQRAYKAQLMPLLGDPQAAVLPGRTGELARQPCPTCRGPPV